MTLKETNMGLLSYAPNLEVIQFWLNKQKFLNLLQSSGADILFHI